MKKETEEGVDERLLPCPFCGGRAGLIARREVIESIPQQKQAQYDLQHQLEDLRIAANKLGLYDAADFLLERS